MWSALIELFSRKAAYDRAYRETSLALSSDVVYGPEYIRCRAIHLGLDLKKERLNQDAEIRKLQREFDKAKEQYDT